MFLRRFRKKPKKAIFAFGGYFESETELREAYLEEQYNDEDDPFDGYSQFSKDLGIWLDHDFIETWWLPDLQAPISAYLAGLLYKDILFAEDQKILEGYKGTSLTFVITEHAGSNERLLDMASNKLPQTKFDFLFARFAA